jgi:hypothetical protein
MAAHQPRQDASSSSLRRHPQPPTAQKKRQDLDDRHRALSKKALSENDAMVYLDGPQVYTCGNCRTHLTSHDDIISKSFHGHHSEFFSPLENPNPLSPSQPERDAHGVRGCLRHPAPRSLSLPSPPKAFSTALHDIVDIVVIVTGRIRPHCLFANLNDATINERTRGQGLERLGYGVTALVL